MIFLTRQANFTSKSYEFSEKEGDSLVGIFMSKGAGHVGLFFVDHRVNPQGVESIELRDFHFQSNKIDYDIRTLDPVDNKHFFFAPAECLDAFTAIGFTAYLQKLVDKNHVIKYGFDWKHPVGIFSKNGDYTPPHSGFGLTCSSFLFEIFKGHDLDLVDMSTWKGNEDSALEWREEYITHRRANLGTLDPALLDELHSQDPFLRLSPPEVAVAIASDVTTLPLDYPTAKALASSVVEDFNTQYNIKKKK